MTSRHGSRSSSRPAARVVARAHAKVNLDLRVLGTRPTATTSCGPSSSRSSCTTADGGARARPASCCAAGPGRADRRAQPRRGARRGALAGARSYRRSGDTAITLEKAIPMEADSAAAAPTRPRPSRRWRGSGAARRCRCCARSGPVSAPTCPFFLSGGTALGLGRGDEIYPLVDLPPHWVVVVRPPFGVSTGGLRLVRRGPRGGAPRAARDLQMLPVPWPSRAAQMVNDLEPPVMRRHPEIRRSRQALRDAGPSRPRCRAAARRFSGCFGPGRRRRGRSGRWRAAAAGHPDPHAVARRARAPRSRAAPV
jgi:4-diphosphocytidyl-2-C-methyl-D-erythritol kinase